MRTQRAGSPAEGREQARRGGLRGGRRGTGWRSHTFGDGVCSIMLTGALDTDAAERLRARLRELMERGCERLIVDLTAVSVPGREEGGLLAEIYDQHTPSCDVVVVLASRSPLADLLPAGASLAGSLSDARRLLGSHATQWDARPRPVHDGALSAHERHALAVRQALRWAEHSAAEGDYESALAALATIERVDGSLAQRWQERRQAWLLACGRASSASP
jgi:hypothetical protein